MLQKVKLFWLLLLSLNVIYAQELDENFSTPLDSITTNPQQTGQPKSSTTIPTTPTTPTATATTTTTKQTGQPQQPVTAVTAPVQEQNQPQNRFPLPKNAAEIGYNLYRISMEEQLGDMDMTEQIEEYQYIPWFESNQYKDFYGWLNQYDLPIYFLLLLIIVISVINNISCYNLDKVNRVKEISIYTILSINRYQIKLILILKNIVLNIIGITIGSFLSFIILYLEYKYHWIQLPSDIYFTDTLPITFDFRFYFYPSLIILLISSIYLTIANIGIRRSG